MLKGRGTAENIPNRFEPLHYELDGDEVELGSLKPRTQYYRDTTRSLITYNDSPDVLFSASINPYRGCEHGCAYCYARPYHEYLGMSAGLDFESKIMVKEDAAQILRKELAAKSWEPQMLAISGVTDCYQPIERRLCITRQCLEVLLDFRNPVGIVTKNHLVTRDLDLLAGLARFKAASVFLSITTLDGALCRELEPRASQPAGRLAAIRELAQAGVPVGVMVAPIIPGLNDHEIPAIVQAAAEVGARYAGYITLRLPLAVAPIFERWLDQHVPDKKVKVLERIRQMHGGRLNDPRFKHRMRGEGPMAQAIKDLFTLACKKTGIHGRATELSTASFRSPGGTQRELF